jgi:hypothetical protein
MLKCLAFIKKSALKNKIIRVNMFTISILDIDIDRTNDTTKKSPFSKLRKKEKEYLRNNDQKENEVSI